MYRSLTWVIQRSQNWSGYRSVAWVIQRFQNWSGRGKGSGRMSGRVGGPGGVKMGPGWICAYYSSSKWNMEHFSLLCVFQMIFVFPWLICVYYSNSKWKMEHLSLLCLFQMICMCPWLICAYYGSSKWNMEHLSLLCVFQMIFVFPWLICAYYVASRIWWIATSLYLQCSLHFGAKNKIIVFITKVGRPQISTYYIKFSWLVVKKHWFLQQS